MIDDDFGVYREAKVDEAAGGRSAFFDGQYTDGYLRASGDGDGQVLSSFKRKHTSGDVLGGGVQVDIRCAKCVKRSLGDASCFECAKMGNSSSSPRNVAYPSPIELYAPSLIDEGAHSWDHSGPPVTTRPRSAFRSGKWNQHGMGESAIQYGTGFMGDD
ncbi:hypothetical protein BC829DRAFT_392714 [Chytridium lagenaria]|nr:hypothetical protein BC829DRAFT_392714 [Chytridium lagenaria]